MDEKISIKRQSYFIVKYKALRETDILYIL